MRNIESGKVTLGVKAMVERAINEASNSLNSKLAEINRVLSGVLDQADRVQTDQHMRKDVEGIRKALNASGDDNRKDYKEAVRILAAESQINGNAKIRELSPGVNHIASLANTMYAVSLIKLDDKESLAQAERLLTFERLRDLAGENKLVHVQDLNKKALRLAFLKLGKDAEAKYADMIDELFQVVKTHGMTTEWLNGAIHTKNEHIKQAGKEMARKQEQMLTTFDENRRQRLMQEQTNLCNSSNADQITLLQTQGMLAVFSNSDNAAKRDNARAEEFFKAAFNVIDQDDRLRTPGRRDQSVVHQVDPEYTQVASSLYAFSLADQGKFAEAERRFAKEVQRDQQGLNSQDSTVKELNKLGLEFVRLKQRASKTATGSCQPRAVEMMPLPRAVLR